MKFCIMFFLLVCSFQAWALNATHFTVTRITSPYFIVDANSPSTLTKAYVGFEIVNNNSSGVTYSGLKFAISSIGTSVTGQNYSVLSPASGVINVGTLAPGQSKVCYFYLSYPAIVTVQATVNTLLSDNTPGSKTQNFTINNRSSISANAGGTATQSFTNQDIIGGTVIDDVTYAVGNVQNGDECDFQVAVSNQFDPTKLTLLSTQVIASTVPGIPNGATDSLYFVTGSGSNGASITIRWTFRITGYNYTNYLLPCSGATSGNTNYKYTLNTNLGTGSPITISANANPLTITKSSDRSTYLLNSPAVFTITIQNPGAYGISIDRITDELPAGFTYQSLDASSQVNGSNSTTVPSTGTTGALTFEGGVGPSGTASYYIPAGGSLVLKYRALSSSTPASNQVTNARDYVGGTLVGTAQNTLSVAVSLPVSLVSLQGDQTPQGIQLTWSVSREVNTRRFEVHRSNGNNTFSQVGSVSANAGTSGIAIYTFTDPTPLPGTNHYRLKMIDQDGSFAFSPVLSISTAELAPGKNGVYPNPYTGATSLNIFLDREMPVNMTIFDEGGKLLSTRRYVGSKGANIIRMYELGRLSAGSYILQVSTPKGNQQFRITKL